jgi:phage baseplate assembly protein W
MIDENYARDISWPLRFDEDCDLAVDEDREVIDQALHLLAFIRRGEVPLTETFGSALEDSIFDFLDDATELAIDSSLRRAYEANEPRVFLDREFLFDESPDERKLVIIIPFRIVVTGEAATSRIVVSRPIG